MKTIKAVGIAVLFFFGAIAAQAQEIKEVKLHRKPVLKIKQMKQKQSIKKIRKKKIKGNTVPVRKYELKKAAEKGVRPEKVHH